MVARNDVMIAAENVDRALQDFVQRRAEAKVLVFINKWGHLHAVVATHGFEGIPHEKRVERIRAHLKESVSQEDLGYLYHIEPLTAAEYDARLLGASQISESKDFFIEGSDQGDTADE